MLIKLEIETDKVINMAMYNKLSLAVARGLSSTPFTGLELDTNTAIPPIIKAANAAPNVSNIIYLFLFILSISLYNL